MVGNTRNDNFVSRDKPILYQIKSQPLTFTLVQIKYQSNYIKYYIL